MRKSGFLVFSLLFLGSLANANEACLLETNAVMMGIQLDIKDCMQNAGMPQDDFKATCEATSQAAVSMGGPAAKITYMDSCPTPFQAKCDIKKTASMVFYYYKRAADEFPGIASSCELMEGVYTEGSI